MTDREDNIPILGQPAEIVHWWPTTVVQCKCRGDGLLTIVILTGFGNHTECGFCGKLYFNKGMTPDGKGGLNILVDFIIPVPKSQLQ